MRTLHFSMEFLIFLEGMVWYKCFVVPFWMPLEYCRKLNNWVGLTPFSGAVVHNGCGKPV